MKRLFSTFESPSTSAGPSGVKEDSPKVNDSLYELHRPSGVPSVQILFFHGLPLGNYSTVHLSTWECGDGSSDLWPQTWLVQEFPGAHVFAVRYSYGLEKGSVKSFDMKVIRENLLWDLLQQNIGQVQGCPVVLIGHCIGGLIIKELCLEAHNMLSLSRDSMEKAQLENFLNRTAGIFYYSTPHHGIPDIARAADLVDSPLFKYFEKLSVQAERLNSDFIRLCDLHSTWRIKGLAAALPVQLGVFKGVVVVPEGSARMGMLNVDTADHFSVCKPPDKTSRRFEYLTRLLHNIVSNPKEETYRADSEWVPKQVRGIAIPLQEIKSKLESVTRLCLTGMGGSGKTTLAKVVFNELGSKFEYTCFVSDVKYIQGNAKALKQEVWKQMHRSGQKVGEDPDWSKIRRKRLLLVLDDLSGERDVNVLSEIADGSSSESRFIATSRKRGLLYYDYEVPLLDEDNARQLFMEYAFPNQAAPRDDLGSLVGEIVEKCEGLPLTLEIFGNLLRRKKMKEDWKQVLHALENAQAFDDVNERLWAKLRVSYDELEENEKQMFLDISTFFTHHVHGPPLLTWTLRDAKAAWREAYGVRENLSWESLVDRSLVYNVGEDETMKVHEQLRSLGQKIAAESSHRWRGTWREMLELFNNTDNSHNKDIHAIQSADSGEERVPVPSSALRKPTNLRHVHFQSYVTIMGAQNQSVESQDIRVPVPSSALQKLTNLRYLDFPHYVTIEGARNDSSILSNLVLLRCKGLQFLDPACQSRLAVLKLWSVEENYLLNSIGQLSALRIFYLIGALKLHTLPDEIGKLSRLEFLHLTFCKNLQTLPETLGQLSNMRYLEIRFCYKLRTLPKSVGNLSALHHLHLVHLHELQTLPESFGQLGALTRLSIIECNKFQSLPNSFGSLSGLVELTISDCQELRSLPASFGKLRALSNLDLGSLYKLQTLPESFGQLSAFNHLSIRRCENFTSLPNSFGSLSALVDLRIKDCPELRSLPDSFGNLHSLSYLKLKECRNLDSLPESLGRLTKLLYLEISGLIPYDNPTLEGLPGCLAELKALRHLSLGFLCIESIPECIKNLPSLRTLELCVLPLVVELPPWLGEAGEKLLAQSRKLFDVQDGTFSLTRDEIELRRSLLDPGVAHKLLISKVRRSDYGGALAASAFSNLVDSDPFLLQERGIVKRMMGDLQGALKDLTRALELCGDDYECWKQRGYVKYLLGDVEGARMDAERCLTVKDTRDIETNYLGALSIAFLEFNLE